MRGLAGGPNPPQGQRNNEIRGASDPDNDIQMRSYATLLQHDHGHPSKPFHFVVQHY